MVKYEPNKWNKNKHITHSHNCYSYFLNKISPVEELRCKAIEQKMGSTNKCKTPQPGYADGLNPTLYKQTRKTRTSDGFRYKCSNVLPRIRKDNKDIQYLGNGREAFHKKCPNDMYKGALVTTGPDSWKHSDYHFYRQDENGYWSHKDGKNPVKNYDAKNNKIVDPYLADRNYKNNKYTDFCGYFCVPNNDGGKQMSSVNNTKTKKKSHTKKAKKTLKSPLNKTNNRKKKYQTRKKK